MFGCASIDLFRSKRKNLRLLRNTATIEIRSVTPDDKQSWRAAVLSSDPKSNQNVVSQRLVSKVLGQTIHPLDKEGSSSNKPRRHGEEEVEGYVDLVWCMESRRSIHTTRFFVSSAYDPPYDAVLGKEDSSHHNMLKNSKGRPRRAAKA